MSGKPAVGRITPKLVRVIPSAMKAPIKSMLKAVGLRRDPVSETSKCRPRLLRYCDGYGIDIGPGGDPIKPSAVRVDLPTPYSHVGNLPVQLGGNATDLHWFKDGTLDYLYSSHVLEDFEDTAAVLREWLRVLKPGGHLVIFCPDEQAYRKHCAATGQIYNTAHVHANFSLAFAKQALATVADAEIVHENPLVDVYSWELVCRRPATLR